MPGEPQSQAQAIGEILTWLEQQVRANREEQLRQLSQLDQLRRQIHDLSEEMNTAERAVREIDPKLAPFKGLPEKIRSLDEGAEHLRQAITTNKAEMDNSRRVLGDKVTFCKSVAEATQGADAVALVTEWNEFITQDWTKIAKLMRGKHVFDGRNCLASGKVSAAGLYYHAVGRPELAPGEGKQGKVGVVTAG